MNLRFTASFINREETQMKRKIFALLLVLCLLAGLLSGCGQAAPAASEPPAEESPAATEPAAEESQTPETREFTDSTGRTVTVPWGSAEPPWPANTVTL